MGIFDRFRTNKRANRIEPTLGNVPAQPSRIPALKRYAAAGSKARFGDFMAGPTSRSADAELNIALATLRARSRSLRRDNAHARRYFQLREDNVVGSRSIVFMSEARNADGTLDETGNRRVEAAWKEWCHRPTLDGTQSFADVLRMVDAARACDGDCFIELYVDKKYKDNFAIKVYEADMVDETKNGRLPNGNIVKMGVELDVNERPVAYHFLTYHRGDADWTGSTEKSHKVVSADRVIHVFRRNRPHQSRGEPELCAVMNDLKMLGGYREAEVVGRRLRASLGGFFKKSLPTDDGTSVADQIADDGMPEMTVEPGVIRALPPGWEFQEFDPNNGGEDGAIFEKKVLRSVAAGLGVSYNSLASDLEGVSYSSIRQGTLEDREKWKTEQEWLIDHVVRPIFTKWLATWFEFGENSLPYQRFKKFESGARFVGRRWGWVDPEKDVDATIKEIDAGLTSPSQVASDRGFDYKEIIETLASDQALIKASGAQLGQIKNAGTPKPAKSDGTTTSGNSGGSAKGK